MHQQARALIINAISTKLATMMDQTPREWPDIEEWSGNFAHADSQEDHRACDDFLGVSSDVTGQDGEDDQKRGIISASEVVAG